MIPEPDIISHQKVAPWSRLQQVEQDLAISRMLVEIYRNQALADRFAFRGGTALMKLHFPGTRYSEDIDLVQLKPEGIGKSWDMLRAMFDVDFGEPERIRKDMISTLKYHFQSESLPSIKLTIKIEINVKAGILCLDLISNPFL